MPGPSRKLSFSIYEDADCRIPGSLPRLDAGAGQMGLSTHIPSRPPRPPPRPPPPPPFTTRVPSTAASSSSSSSASSAAGYVGRTGSTAYLSPPFTVRVPSSGSSTTSSSVVGRSRPSDLTTPVDPHQCDSGTALVFRVPSTVSSSSVSSSASFSSTGSFARLAGRSGLTTPVGTRHYATDNNPFRIKRPSTGPFSLRRGSGRSLPGNGFPFSSSSSSSIGSFHSCSSGVPLLVGSGVPGTGSTSSPLPPGSVRWADCSSIDPCRAIQQQQSTPAGTPRPTGFSDTYDVKASNSFGRQKGLDVGVKKRVPRRRQPQIRMSFTDSRVWKASTPTTSLTYDEPVETGSLGGPEQPGYGAQQEKQQHAPAETPGSQKCVDVFVEDWIRESIDQDGIASVRQEDVSDHIGQRQKEQQPTPADTPACQSVIVVPAKAPWADDDTTDTLEDLERLSLADNEVEEGQPRVLHGHLQSTQLPPSILVSRRGPQPRDALGRFASYSTSGGVKIPRQRGFRVRKSVRSRRRNEIELTMYHAICWSGMGDIVPNVSVATGEPLERMPLPCTFGEGSGRKPVGDEEDFAVGVSRELVREIEKCWARRARRARRKEAGM
ncbi:hypothetical protein VP1G_06145 [Cytospora mali]|uniref:Uncharacterized protein n=1 Tax=Cytospora mali TaxID=578113 RepID=A0A194V4Q0_CYTMA|nr:hypothetical protein VP1G_06145 [Valsa mali var. pyri (nom. inval.)]